MPPRLALRERGKGKGGDLFLDSLDDLAVVNHLFEHSGDLLHGQHGVCYRKNLVDFRSAHTVGAVQGFRDGVEHLFVGFVLLEFAEFAL